MNPPDVSAPAAVAVGDCNGDGNLDLAVANQNPGSITILPGDGPGHFTAVAASTATGSNKPYALAVGDFNGDGISDLAVANEDSNNITVLLGDGTGRSTATAVSPAVEGSQASIAVGDFNGDGHLDLAIANQGGLSVTILLGDGTGNFTANAATPSLNDNPDSIAIGDFNGDGRLDIVTANLGNLASILLQVLQAPQTITFSTNPPASAAHNSQFTVAASASSNLPVAYTSSGSCTNSGATYTITGSTGTCSVIVNQAGNSQYLAAPQVTETVSATPVNQTISFSTNAPASAA